MRLLALDTAAEACSVGVVVDPARSPVTRTEIVGRGHAERLMDMVEATMREAGLPLADLERVVVTIGPGSFTGLRIGIAAARGLALALGCPVVGIGTLPVHAEAARALAGAQPVLALIDARRGEVYGQFFAADGVACGPPRVASAAAFAAGIDDAQTMLAGSGADAVAALLTDEGQTRVVHRNASPDITALCRLGLAAPASAAPRPLYLRPPDAKPQPGLTLQ